MRTRNSKRRMQKDSGFDTTIIERAVLRKREKPESDGNTPDY